MSARSAAVWRRSAARASTPKRGPRSTAASRSSGSASACNSCTSARTRTPTPAASRSCRAPSARSPKASSDRRCSGTRSRSPTAATRSSPGSTSRRGSTSSTRTRPRPARDVVATCDYGGPVVAAVARENLWATQFHPEKSSSNGIQVLANFVAACAVSMTSFSAIDLRGRRAAYGCTRATTTRRPSTATTRSRVAPSAFAAAGAPLEPRVDLDASRSQRAGNRADGEPCAATAGRARRRSVSAGGGAEHAIGPGRHAASGRRAPPARHRVRPTPSSRGPVPADLVGGDPLVVAVVPFGAGRRRLRRRPSLDGPPMRVVDGPADGSSPQIERDGTLDSPDLESLAGVLARRRR